MKTGELLNGYFIEQRKPDDFTLKKKYFGMRNGISTECEKIVSHHQSFESAAERFLGLFQCECLEDRLVTIPEYIKAIKQANSQALLSIWQCQEEMEVSEQEETEEGSEPPIVSLVPVGHENAIRRELLVSLCVANGLIDETLGEEAKDRAMRKLIKDVGGRNTIVNVGDGKGYFRTTHDDMAFLKKFITSGDRRIKSSAKNLAPAKRLYSDYAAGRL